MLQVHVAAQSEGVLVERRRKILMVNASSSRGGAAKAALRLYRAMQQAGRYDLAWMSNEPSPVVDGGLYPRAADSVAGRVCGIFRTFRRRGLERLRPMTSLAGDLRFDYGSAFAPADVLDAVPDCDLVHLNWVSGLIDPATVARIAIGRAPVLWTLHDMAPLTGGCHFDGGCGGFVDGCRGCPQLGGLTGFDFTGRRLRLKQQEFGRIPEGRLHLVAPSRWLAQEAARSPLYCSRPVHVIPNTIDLELFQPRDRARARHRFGLPAEGPVILFVAKKLGNRRKGTDLLAQIVERIRAALPDVAVALAGSGLDRRAFPFDHRHLGDIIDEDQLAEVYSLADVTLIPSLQDNLPNVMIESMACGVPVAAFSVGGIPDLVTDGHTGVLAARGDVDGLANAVVALLGDREFRAAAPGRCRGAIEKDCCPQRQSEEYSRLYEQMIEAAR
jgi:glycosyltransferase involved in cell wall biosynthesis